MAKESQKHRDSSATHQNDKNKRGKMKRIYSITAIFLFACIIIAGEVRGQGCMEAKSEEGVSVAGFFQVQPQYFLKDTAEFTFAFKRVRFALLGNIPYDVSYYAAFEFSPFVLGGNTPCVLDGYVTFSRFAPYGTITMGQFKSPFSLELNTSCAGFHTINRSTVVKKLAGPGRDIGMMIGGKYDKLFSCNLGLMNGTGMGKKDNNKAKDIVGRVILSPIEFLNVGGSFRHGKVGADEEDEKIRFGGEVELKYDDFLVQGEYIYGKDISQDTTEKNGLFVQGMYMTQWKVQPVVKYESWDPNMDTEKNKEQITTFGINYFLNDWTRIQVNYLYCAEEDLVEIDNDQILIQIQVKF